MSSSSLFALVPVRSFHTGKSRLTSALDPATRTDLIQRMLARVLDASLESHVFQEIAVISLDPDVLRWAEERWQSVTRLQQNELEPGLIPALDAGRVYCREQQHGGLAVLFADLPLIEPSDLVAFTSLPSQIVIAPDGGADGTNALLLRDGPVDLASFQFQFGVTSYPRHLAEANRFGLMPVVHSSAGLSFDLDTAADLGHLSTVHQGEFSFVTGTDA